jgi:hypothetical protein
MLFNSTTFLIFFPIVYHTLSLAPPLAEITEPVIAYCQLYFLWKLELALPNIALDLNNSGFYSRSAPRQDR